MVRYLIHKGAPVNEESSINGNNHWNWNPVCAAARAGNFKSVEEFKAKFEIIKLLYRNGAVINRISYQGWYPIENVKPHANEKTELSYRSKEYYDWPEELAHEVRKFFILNGALCDDEGNFNESIMRKSLSTYAFHHHNFRIDLLAWAEVISTANEGFRIFMLGTRPRNFSPEDLLLILSERLGSGAAKILFDSTPPREKLHCVWKELGLSDNRSPVNSLRGKTDAMKLIADFLGVVRGKEGRILHQLEMHHADEECNCGRCQNNLGKRTTDKVARS